MRGHRAQRGNPSQGCSLRNPLLLRPWCPPILPPLLLSPHWDKGDPDTAGQTQASERAALHSRELKQLLSILLFLPEKAEILPEVRIRAKSHGGRKEAVPVTSREEPRAQMAASATSPLSCRSCLLPGFIYRGCPQSEGWQAVLGSLGGAEGTRKQEGERGEVESMERVKIA